MSEARPANRPGLLVSVRSAEEAEAAVAGGADLIDVKEPSRGSLGRADDETIAAVVRAVGGRRPVSAALGELRDNPALCAVRGLAYVKWGLGGLGPFGTPQLASLLTAQQSSDPGCRCVLVAYADWRRANAPRPEAVCELAVRLGAAGLLVDTYQKNGRTLLDWLGQEQVAELCGRCRHEGLHIALAGSLRRDQIATLRTLNPDWLAVRGAVCRQGQRDSTIDTRRVRDLAELMAERFTPATSAS
jgi:uncharacterized protein (UPF0264 family)